MEVTQHTEIAAAFTCLALMAGMMITFTLGRRAGIKHYKVDPEGARTVSGAVEASIFGLLGLLIAFTFYGASDRFEARRTLITDEVNAIDNAWRNLDLLVERRPGRLARGVARLSRRAPCVLRETPERGGRRARVSTRATDRISDLAARGRRRIARNHSGHDGRLVAVDQPDVRRRDAARDGAAARTRRSRSMDC